MMREATSASVLSDRNDTATDYPHDRTVSQVFEAQAAKTPGRIAVVDGERAVTYEELNRRANQLARHLTRLGVRDDMLVGISMYRSIELLVGQLAILKAGGAYVPLDPDYPEARLSFMAEDAGLALILTHSGSTSHLPARATTVCVAPDGTGAFASESGENRPPASSPDGLAYVMYTSGSTGRPKGVEIPHRGIVRLLFGVDYARFDQGETILHHSPICFDLSTFEVWGALLHGGCCVVYRPRIPTAADLYRQIRQHGVTTLWLTSALYNLVIDENPESLLPIRQLLIGGEALSVSHIRRGVALLPETQLINGYGPTENTTFSCCYRIPKNLPAHLPSIPIGKPIGNSTAYIVGPDGDLVAPGEPGELYVGGAGLARGYWNRAELTAEKFVPSPFGESPDERLYRTGDLARDLPDGTIEYLGRMDFQVKIRGFRVEPGEIEAAFRSHPSVRDVAVVARGPASDKRLGAFVVHHPNRGDAGQLEEFVRSRLPEHMVPSTITAIDRLPLTPNGKIDHAALAALAVPDTAAGRHRPFVAARDQVERQLVELWETLLGRQHIGVTDNFFELGGHSLLAARLFARIEKVFARELPLAVLFQSATIEELAAVIRQESKLEQWASIVPIRTQGSKPPFFCVHGVGGNVLTYREVVAHLPPDQPVYGLQSRGLDGKQSIFTRIEDMAAHYINEIKTVQPHGPYFLGGMSFGGVVAFEMAQQLTASGEVVRILALFDTIAPKAATARTGATAVRRKRQEYLARARFHLANVLFSRERFAYVRKKARTVSRRLGNRVWYAIYDGYQRLGYPLPAVLQRVTQANLYALHRYTPRVYPGPIDLFAASERAIEIVADGDLGWDRLTSDRVNLIKVPGDHLTMLAGANASALAGLLSKRLALATGANS